MPSLLLYSICYKWVTRSSPNWKEGDFSWIPGSKDRSYSVFLALKALVGGGLTMTEKLKWYTGIGRCICGNNYLYQFSCWEIFSVLLGVLSAWVWKTSCHYEIVLFVFVLQCVRYLVLWSGRSWLAGMEEGSHCRVLERPGSRPSWWSEAGYRDKPTWRYENKV